MDTTHALDTDRRGAGSNRLLLIVGVGVAALVVAALAVALLLARNEPVYPAGSPEAAFQAYLRAWDAGDLEGAYAALSPRVRETLALDDYIRESDAYTTYVPGRQVFIEGVERTAERATLVLAIEWRGEGLLASRWTQRDVRVRMVSIEATWYIDQGLLGIEPAYH